MAGNLYPSLPPSNPYAVYDWSPYEPSQLPPAYNPEVSAPPPPPTFGYTPVSYPELPPGYAALPNEEEEEEEEEEQEEEEEEINYFAVEYGLDPDQPPIQEDVAVALARRDLASERPRIAELVPQDATTTTTASDPEPNNPGRFARWIPTAVVQPRETMLRTTSDYKMRGAIGEDVDLLKTLTELIARRIPLKQWSRYNNLHPMQNTSVWPMLDAIASDRTRGHVFLDALELCGWSLADLMKREDLHQCQPKLYKGQRVGVEMVLDGRQLWELLLRWGFSAEILRRPPKKRGVWFNMTVITGVGVGLCQFVQKAGLTIDDLLAGEVTANELGQWARASFEASPVPFMHTQMKMTTNQFSAFKFTPAQWVENLGLTYHMLLAFELLSSVHVRDYLHIERGWSCKTLVEVFGAEEEDAQAVWYPRKPRRAPKKKPKPKKIHHQQQKRKQPLRPPSADFEKGMATLDE